MRLRLESGYAELPEEECERIGSLFVLRLLGRSEAVAGVEVDPQQDRLAAGRRRLQASRHLARFPRVDARIVDPRGQQDRRILRPVLDMVVAAHGVEALEAVFLLHRAE